MVFKTFGFTLLSIAVAVKASSSDPTCNQNWWKVYQKCKDNLDYCVKNTLEGGCLSSALDVTFPHNSNYPGAKFTLDGTSEGSCGYWESDCFWYGTLEGVDYSANLDASKPYIDLWYKLKFTVGDQESGRFPVNCHKKVKSKNYKYYLEKFEWYIFKCFEDNEVRSDRIDCMEYTMKKYQLSQGNAIDTDALEQCFPTSTYEATKMKKFDCEQKYLDDSTSDQIWIQVNCKILKDR
mmetsp:Transcript_10288/g.11818  ORF Transcript_10288/g.11818 Transcript_10288/m.11818 type:complete len:236 (-) Transcript_10288:100-807(-)